MQTDKIVSSPSVGVAYASAEAGGVRRADLGVGSRAGKANVKIAVCPQELGKLDADAVNDVLLA